ncbi:hypothetical protein GU926_03190 [Nibribacter ruber]|uniref:Uncharacterized protein n=1 Tax=Nibribacter ruber TaxID=2698458 RepID=A0A6P1NX57_9BACT|nr:hypothetical protein [Nibribacter ruber]QHL86498.1 hypothetical protein GU926_03190 [Nibribacter ruber]
MNYFPIEAKKLLGSKKQVLGILFSALILAALFHVLVYDSFDQDFINLLHLKMVQEPFHFWLFKVNQIWMLTHVVTMGLLTGLCIKIENGTGWKHYSLFPVSLLKSLLYKQVLVYLGLVLVIVMVSVPLALVSASALEFNIWEPAHLNAFLLLIVHHLLGGLFYSVLLMVLGYFTKNKPTFYYFLIGIIGMLGTFGASLIPGYSFARIKGIPDTITAGIPVSLGVLVVASLLLAAFCYYQGRARATVVAS